MGKDLPLQLAHGQPTNVKMSHKLLKTKNVTSYTAACEEWNPTLQVEGADQAPGNWLEKTHKEVSMAFTYKPHLARL